MPLFGQNTISESCSEPRVAEISFYIEILRQFSNSVNEDYKTQSHGK